MNDLVVAPTSEDQESMKPKSEEKGGASQQELVALFKDLTRIGEIRDRRAEISLEDDTLKGELANIVERAIDTMSDLKIEKITVAGRTYYTLTTIWASIKAGKQEAAFAALREMDLGALIKETVNTSSLSAVIRDMRKEDEPLPANLEGALTITHKRDIGMRRV